MPTVIDPDSEKAVETANCTSSICIATSSSKRRGMGGIGGAIHKSYGRMPSGRLVTFAVTLGPRLEEAPSVAKLEAIVMVVYCLLLYLVRRKIAIFTSNQAAIQVIN